MTTFLIAKHYIDRNRKRRTRRITYRTLLESPFSLDDEKFINLFHVSKPSVQYVCDALHEELRPRSTTRTAIAVESKVFCALRFFATGSYQENVVEDLPFPFSKSSVSRAIVTVAKAINKVLFHKHVSFPHPIKYENIKQGFMEVAGVPGVIGVIDSFHVAVTTPQDIDHHNPQMYINSQGYYSINVQLVCDARMKIIYVNAKYPGSYQESFIWHSSGLRNILQEKFSGDKCDGYLLGDNGYQIEPWLLTPILNPNSIAEETFNKCHKSTRNVMHCCMRQLKRRFKCLRRYPALYYDPTIASLIINACVVLHNICLEDNCNALDSLNDEDGDDLTNEDDEIFEEHDSSTYAAGLLLRENLLKDHFQHT